MPFSLNVGPGGEGGLVVQNDTVAQELMKVRESSVLLVIAKYTGHHNLGLT